MVLGDFFRSLLGIPSKNRPIEPGDDFFQDGDTRNRPSRDGFERGETFRGSFPNGSFFFGTFPSDPFFGNHRQHETRTNEDMEDEQLKSPFGDFFGNPPREFGSQGEDMFRHFDEMFQSFNEIFRSMGIADFPAVPAIPFHPPGDESEQLAPRDSMLKTPDSHRHHNDGQSEKPVITTPQPPFTPSNQPSNVPDKAPFSFFGDSWSMPQWSQPTMPQDPLDSDLDEEVRRGGLLHIIEPYKKSPPSFPGVRIMDPPTKRKTEGYNKSVHVYTYKSAGDKCEERRTEEDGLGNRKTTVTRSLGDQVYSVTTKKSRLGEEEVAQSYTNMDERNKKEFEDQWRERPPLGENPTLRGHGLIFDLFRKGFPGFPSPKS